MTRSKAKRLSTLICEGTKMSKFGGGIFADERDDGALECCVLGAAAHAKLGRIRKDRVERIEKEACNLFDKVNVPDTNEKARKLWKLLMGDTPTVGDLDIGRLTIGRALIHANDGMVGEDPRLEIAAALKKVGL